MSFPSKTSPEAILDAAIKVVEQDGWPALSMRELGKRLGVRASSLYHHFPDRQAIEHALGQRAARTLASEMGQAAVGLEGNRRMDALAKAYLQFARNHPALYHLVAGVASSTDGQPESKALWNLLLEAIAPITGQPDDTAAAVSLWALLHGFAALEAAGKFGASGPQGGLERGLAAMLSGLSRKGNIL